jgi:S-adenosylmethionine uptake transporter
MSTLGFIAGVISIAAYRRAQAAIVAPMQYSQIVWATIFGITIFHEHSDLWTLVGTAIIIASGIYIVMREGTPAVSTTRPVTETRGEFDLGLQPRPSAWLKFFDTRNAPARERTDHS